MSDSTWSRYTPAARGRFLAVLFLVAVLNNFDRNMIGVLLEPIKKEFAVSDTQLGLLSGLCFSLFYAVAGLPIARWADRGSRRAVVAWSVAAWSFMTLCCGLAHSFWQLALARVGVGVGEAGAIPAAQSLIVDYFPPPQRAPAIAFLTSAATVGYVLGVGLSGLIAGTQGWRMAFLVAGMPGLLVALAAWLGLAEPRRGRSEAASEGAVDALKWLWRKQSYLWALGGCIFYFLFAYGALVFIPSFLVRVLKEPLARVSITYATVAASGSGLGTVIGGVLGGGLGKRDPRWLAWLPAIAFAITVPVFAAALSASTTKIFYVFAFVAWTSLNAGFSVVFAAVHVVCGSKRRATAIAFLLFVCTLIGGGLGPLAAGYLSDLLSIRYGAEGLRFSLVAMVAALIPAALLFYLFGKTMQRDAER